jgi:hypothetical protein
MARRFTIICLISLVFALGLRAVVENNRRIPHHSQIGLDAPCPQPIGTSCRSRG